MKATAVLILALAILAGAVVLNNKRASLPPDLVRPAASPADSANTVGTNESGNAESAISTTTADSEQSESLANSADQFQSDSQPIAVVSNTVEQDEVDVFDLGTQALDEVSFRYWVGRLRSSPLLLQRAITEYLENNDSTRARNLAAILAEVNSPLVLDAAIQLSQSTDKTEQLNGLELLARLQPNNTHARDNAIDLLATQTDPTLLVATLNVFATPAQAVSAEQRQLLLDHAQLLSTHDDANVRAMSISTISKWSRGNSDSAATIGLSDTDGAVRAKAAASLVGAQNPSAEARQSLLSVAANRSETKTTRQLALYALSKMQLTESDRMRYEALEVEVRRTRH